MITIKNEWISLFIKTAKFFINFFKKTKGRSIVLALDDYRAALKGIFSALRTRKVGSIKPKKEDANRVKRD